MYKPRLLDFKIFIFFQVVVIFALILSKLEAQQILDVRFYYTEIEFQKFFQTLSSKENFRYKLVAFFDLGFLISYTILFYLSLKRLTYKKPLIKFFAIVPGLFDFIETSSILAVLTEVVSVKNLSWIGYFTLLKWISIVLILTLILLGAYFRFKIFFLRLRNQSI